MAEDRSLLANIVSSGDHWDIEEEVDNSLRSSNSLRGLSDVYDSLQESSKELWAPRDLSTLPAREFEILIGVLYGANGYNATITSETHDGGVDVIAERAGEGILIEAKRLGRGSVSVDDVRALHSASQDVHSLPYAICEQIEKVREIAVFTTSQLSGDALLRLSQIGENEQYKAWVASSENICDLLNSSYISQENWLENYRGTVEIG